MIPTALRKFFNLTRTCNGCPAQWDAYDEKGALAYYIRFRFGVLTLYRYKDGAIDRDAGPLSVVQVGGPWAGDMTEEDMLSCLQAERA